MPHSKVRSRGATLFEVLLYIGLFTIISTSAVYLYISILKTADTLTLNLQKIEISIFMRQLAASQIGTDPFIETNNSFNTQKLKSSIERILKYYPNLKLMDIQVEYVFIESAPQIIDARIGTNVYPTVKLTYRLELQSQSQTKKIFLNTIYLSLL